MERHAAPFFLSLVHSTNNMLNDHYIEDQHFRYEGPGIHDLQLGTYEGCHFVNGNFTGQDLTDCKFLDCVFDHCILDRVNMTNVSFNAVQFLHCKMMGIAFDKANEHLFIVDLKHCILNYSSFRERRMPGFTFEHCEMQEVDFEATDLTNANFHHCMLQRARFEHTTLIRADFRTATHYTIDPEKNKMKKARFKLEGVAGLLEKYHIDLS